MSGDRRAVVLAQGCFPADRPIFMDILLSSSITLQMAHLAFGIVASRHAVSYISINGSLLRNVTTFVESPLPGGGLMRVAVYCRTWPTKASA